MLYLLLEIETVYDEPSQPDPIYQEIAVNNEPDTPMEMTENDSYMATKITIDSEIILSECPAYAKIRH